MDHVDPDQEDNENAMDVDHSDPPEVAPQEFIHPLALVALNVEENVEPQEGDVVVEIETNEIGEISPTISTSSLSPVNFDDESSHSAEVAEVDENSPPAKKRSLNESDPNDDDGAICPICFDNWTNTGEHRICALKCGHLFGYNCVNRWLTEQSKKTCPTCKKKVCRRDIRYIYAKRLTAVDTTELEKVRIDLKLMTEERNRAQCDIVKYACREQLLHQELALLKSQLTSNKTVHLTVNSIKTPYVRLFMDKSMEICKYGGSRVFDANCSLDLLLASMKSPTNLFTGFGLKKINISYYRLTAFIPVHSLQIRDICFHPENNLVLTASMDKTFKVVDNVTNSVTHQFNHQMPLWSCCWDLNNQNTLYVGTQSGSVIKYDIRRLAEPVADLAIEGCMSPVVSIASIPAVPGVVLPQGGVVSCKLNSLWVYENNPQHTRHSLSLEGPFVSMKYQPSTKQLLVSSRPNSRISYSRHTLCTLEKMGQEKVDCNVIHSFQGGGMQKLLSKSCFLSDTSEYVAAHQENCRSVFLWSINTGEKVCSVPAHETVLDLKGIQNHNGNYLVSLTEKKLEFFKFTS